MRRVIIVSCRAPWFGEKREGDEVWCVNTAFMSPTNQQDVDRVYFADTPDDFIRHRGQNFIEQLNATGAEVWCQNHYDSLPTSRRIPVEEMIEKWGAKYFTSTIAYMIAHALYEGCDELVLHRINSAVASQEYYHQKPCHDFWCGVAIGMGVRVFTSPDAFLMKPHPWCAPLYGFWRQKSEKEINAILRVRMMEIMRKPIELEEISPVTGFKPPKYVQGARIR